MAVRFIAGLAAAVIALLLGLYLATWGVWARDLGQWDKVDPEISKWFGSLMRPDFPDSSCCGESDAYWADSYEIDRDTGNYIAIITDERPDIPLKRTPVPVGTRIVIQKEKIKFDQGNPTGHGIVFMSVASALSGVSNTVFCFLPPGGV